MAFVVDSSALVAILQREPEASAFNSKLTQEDHIYLGAVTLLEASTVMLSKRGNDGLAELNQFLEALRPEVVAFDVALSQIAIQAAHTYGKGRHPASLNFGDCCSYALAKFLDLPLFFKGNDFLQTDLRAVV